MKKTLLEQIERIHVLTYGKTMVKEGLLENIIGSNDEKKADEVEPDVKKFYDTLENASEGQGISEQQKGSMTFQKDVETMQIGLELLGYKLPIYGVDGKFGPETAEAVRKFTQDKVDVNRLHESFVEIASTDYSNVKVDNDSKYDEVNDALLADIQQAGQASNVVATITTATSGHSEYSTTGNKSRHGFGTAVDVSILNGVSYGDPNFKVYGDKLKDALVSMGYVWNSESGNSKAVLWQTSTGGNHYNHLHISNKEGVSGTPSVGSGNAIGQGEVATPEMLKTLLRLLKERGVKASEIQQYTNIEGINYTGSTDNEFYQELLKALQAPVSDENMKFLFAWRQAEGKGGINNPFNTTLKLPESTVINKDGVRNYATAKDGLIATVKTLKNGYYDCIVSGLKNDIGADKIAQCESLKTWGTGELVAQVVNGYNSGAKPRIQPLA